MYNMNEFYVKIQLIEKIMIHRSKILTEGRD